MGIRICENNSDGDGDGDRVDLLNSPIYRSSIKVIYSVAFRISFLLYKVIQAIPNTSSHLGSHGISIEPHE